MGYSNFKKIKTVSRKFKIDVLLVDLFNNIQPIQPSSWLLESLQIAKRMPMTNEKSKAATSKINCKPAGRPMCSILLKRALEYFPIIKPGRY